MFMRMHALERWGRAWRGCRTEWRTLLLFDGLCKLVAIALVAPVSAWFLQAILRWSGDQTISNYDLVAFFLAPPGLLFIVVAATFAFAILFVELGGLSLIVLAAARDRRISALRLLAFLASRLVELCRLGLRMFLVFSLLAAPVVLVALAVKATFLGGGDIYYYLTARPPAFWAATAILATAALLSAAAGLWFSIQWVYALPLLLIEGLRPREALAESSRLARAAGRGHILARLAICTAGILLLSGLAGLLHAWLDLGLLSLAGDTVNRAVYATALSLAIAVGLGLALGFAGSVAVAAVFAKFYSEARPEFELPAALDSAAPAIARRSPLALGSVVVAATAGLLGLAALISLSLIDQLHLDHSVKTTAHRGASWETPENTLAALERAVRDGADYAEIDVQRTADGVVVLLHDTDLRRVAGLHANIWDLTYEDIRRLDVGTWFSSEFAGERVPTLAEAIAAVDGRMGLNIELKVNGHDDGLAVSVAAVLREAACGAACVVSSLDYAAMREISRHAPGLRRGLIVTASLGDAARFDVDFLALNAGTVSRGLIDRAHRAGLEAHVWTVNEPAQMLSMLHMGVDNILTSRPDVLVDLLRTRAEMSEMEKTLLLLADLTPGRLWRFWPAKVTQAP